MISDSNPDQYSQWFAFTLNEEEGIVDCRDWQRNPEHLRWMQSLNQGLYD